MHPPNKLQQTTVSVKGCEVDSVQVKEAVGRIINYFASDTPVSSYETVLDLDGPGRNLSMFFIGSF